jgi:hypothetical protein
MTAYLNTGTQFVWLSDASGIRCPVNRWLLYSVTALRVILNKGERTMAKFIKLIFKQTFTLVPLAILMLVSLAQEKDWTGLVPHSQFSLRENPKFLQNFRSKNNTLKEKF